MSNVLPLSREALHILDLTDMIAKRRGSRLRGTQDFLLSFLWGNSGYAHELLSSFSLSYESVWEFLGPSPSSTDDGRPLQFGPDALQLLGSAQEQARHYCSRELQPEHQLLGMLQHDGSTACKTIEHFGVSPSDVADKVRSAIRTRHLERTVMAGQTLVDRIKQTMSSCKDDEQRAQLKAVLDAAQSTAESLGQFLRQHDA